jgi:hypothetical protein
MRKQDISVDELVGMIRRQELQLPEIQRQYVWRAPKVRDLLDSLYRGYPSGTILVWETDQPVPTRNLAVEQGQTAFEGQKLLLDGQQRLTSLAAVMSGQPVKVRGRKNPIDILFNLDHPEGPPVDITEVEEDGEPVAADDEAVSDDSDEDEDNEDDLQERLKQRTFVVYSKALARQSNWVSVTRVFGDATDAELLKRAGVNSFDDPRYQRYMTRLNRLRTIRKYMYVMHVLNRDLSYEEVTEIFVRVNSLGVKLRSSDLALAQITARWRKYLDLVEQFQAQCEKRWFTLDTGLLVRTMVVFASKQGKFQRAGALPLETLQAGWEQAKFGLQFAINFLQSNADIDDETLLSAPTLMIPVAVYSRLKAEKLSKQEGRDLLYWLHVANLRGRYSRGSSETLLNEDLSILFKGGTPADLLQPIVRLFGRLDVLPSDLAGRPARSPLFPMSYLTLKALGAKDWETGVTLALGLVGRQHVIQYHHIFPKALLKEEGYEGAEINEVANLAFIAGRTNQRIGRKSPEAYFPRIIEHRGEEALTAQLIPLDPLLWNVKNYRDFLTWRREKLAEEINRYLLRARDGQSPMADPGPLPASH